MEREGSATTARQDEILDHAFELVRKSGLAGLTMKKVAERVGFTEPALYRHFATKQALVLGVARRLGERLLGPARAIAAEEGTPVAVRLERILTHHLDLVVQTNGLPFLLLAEASVFHDEDVAAALSEVMRSYLELLSGLVAEMPRSPNMPPPRDLVMPLVGLVAAAAIQLRVLRTLPLDPRTARNLIPYLVRRLTSPDPAGGEETA